MQSIEQVILQRRNISPLKMNGAKIPDERIQEFLALADWAPTHGNTEPWHFTIFSGDKVAQFCQDHAELYKQHTEPEKFEQLKYEKIASLHRASHILAIAMKGGSRFPETEEIAAVACAVQNIWLAATAHGIAGYWGSGGMTYHPAMREYLQLVPADKVLGFLYLGHIDGPWPQGRRLKPLESKVRWL